MAQPEDDTLIARMAAGDEVALHTFYDRYRPRLRRYLWHQLDGDLSRVEDLLQEIFLAAWQTAATFRGTAQVATWLFQIAHHRVAHARRADARRPEGHLAPPLDPNDSGAAGAWGHVAHEDAVVDRLALDDALAELAPKHREVLELLFIQGFTSDEVAAILSVPPGTIRSRLTYARRALHEALQRARQLEDVRHDA
jgi:RNA polymerase sigma-70 factor (ECF subfamily)